MIPGTMVEIVGDRYGNNAGLDMPEILGLKGILGTSPTIGFWWVNLPDGTNLLAAETELKDLSAAP